MIQDSLSTNISMFLRSFIFIVFVLIIMFVYSAQLTGTTFGGIVPSVLILGVYGMKMKNLQKSMQEHKGLMSNVADEAFGNIRTVKAFSNESEESDKFEVHSRKVYDVAITKAIWYGGFTFLI